MIDLNITESEIYFRDGLEGLEKLFLSEGCQTTSNKPFKQN